MTLNGKTREGIYTIGQLLRWVTPIGIGLIAYLGNLSVVSLQESVNAVDSKVTEIRSEAREINRLQWERISVHNEAITRHEGEILRNSDDIDDNATRLDQHWGYIRNLELENARNRPGG